MVRHGIDDVNLMAVVGEPGSVDSRASTNVQDPKRTRREASPDDLLGADELETTRPEGEALTLVDVVLVVVPNLLGHVGHQGSVEGAQERTVALRAAAEEGEEPPLVVVGGSTARPNARGPRKASASRA